MNTFNVQVLPKVRKRGEKKRGYSTYDHLEELFKAYDHARFAFCDASHLLLDFSIDKKLTAEAREILMEARETFTRDFLLVTYPTHEEEACGIQFVWRDKGVKLGFNPMEIILNEFTALTEDSISYYCCDPEAPDDLAPNDLSTSTNAKIRQERLHFIECCKNYTVNLRAFINTFKQKIAKVGVQVQHKKLVTEAELQIKAETALKLKSNLEQQDVTKQNADNFFDKLSEDLADAPEYIKSTFEHFYQEYKYKYVTVYERGFMTKNTAQVFAIQLSQFIKTVVKIILEDIKRGKELSPFKTKSTADTNTSSKTTTDQRKEPRKLKPDKISVSNSDQQQTESASDADSPSHRFKVTPKKLKFC